MTELSISDTQVILIFSRDDPRRTILFDHRTSRMAYKVTTTGDERSGDLKYETLYEVGSSQQPLATYRRARDVSVPPPGSDLSSPSMLSLPWLSTSTLHTVRNNAAPSAGSRVEKEEYKRRVPATLALSPAAISMQDQVVICYLLFQRSRRSPSSSHTEDDVSVSADGKSLVNAVGEPMRIQDHKNTAIDQLAAAYASFSWY
ncbi:hypothetical protein GGG16DRAFT_112509 [Schizophyllum commune]